MSTSRRTTPTYCDTHQDRRARSEEPHGLILRPNREYAKNDEKAVKTTHDTTSDDGRDDHLCLTYGDLRRRQAVNQDENSD